MSDNINNWYALYTKPRWEKKVAKSLEDQGVEFYCPLNKVTKQWSDRKKIVVEPIFKSYVFVKVEMAQHSELKTIEGVLNFVYWLKKPAIIKDEEINTIRKFLNEFNDVTVSQIPQLKPNARVRIKQGLMMEYHGVLIEVKGSKAKVRIESMGVYLVAHFDKKNLELVL